MSTSLRDSTKKGVKLVGYPVLILFLLSSITQVLPMTAYSLLLVNELNIQPSVLNTYYATSFLPWSFKVPKFCSFFFLSFLSSGWAFEFPTGVLWGVVWQCSFAWITKKILCDIVFTFELPSYLDQCSLCEFCLDDVCYSNPIQCCIFVQVFSCSFWFMAGQY